MGRKVSDHKGKQSGAGEENTEKGEKERKKSKR